MQQVQKAISSEVISQIQTLIAKGIDAWTQAGKLIAKEIDKAENVDEARDELSELLNVEVEFIDRFYAIGKGITYAPLLVMNGPGVTALLKCPYALQERHADKPVDVLIRRGDEWDTLKVNVVNLTADQARQVFKNGEIRSTAAQRAFVESRALSKFNPRAVNDAPYKIVGKRLVIKNGPTFTTADLARILVEMEH